MELTTLTGLLLIIVPIAFNVTFFLLQRAFEYPDILRKSTDYVLQRFKDGGAPLRRLWYAFTLSAVLFSRQCYLHLSRSWCNKYSNQQCPGIS
jgi:hypothetical protein